MFLLMWLGVAVGNRFLFPIAEMVLTVPKSALVELASCESRLWEMVLSVRYLYLFPLVTVTKLALTILGTCRCSGLRTASVVWLAPARCANLSKLAVAVISTGAGRVLATAQPGVAVLRYSLSVIPAGVAANQYHFASPLTNGVASPANLGMAVPKRYDHTAKSTAKIPNPSQGCG